MTLTEKNVDLYAIMKPVYHPIPVTLSVDCPCCGKGIEYTPDEDDSAVFYAGQDWPCCVECKVLIDVHPVRIVVVDETYHVDGRR